MKKTLLTILGLILIARLFAQEIPQKISYQGKLYENDSPVTGTKSIKFTIGTWSETHSNVEITNGLYSVQLGDITPIPLNIFNNSSNVSLQIAVEGNNLSPQTDILSVPYAFKAEKAVTAENVPTKLSDLTNDEGFIKSANDADANPTNEIQKLSKSGSNITLSKNGGSVSINDADADASNEIQTLSINGSSVNLSRGGGSINIPTGNSIWSKNGNDIYYNSGTVLIGTTSGGNSKLRIETGAHDDAINIKNNSSGQMAIRISNNAGASRPLMIQNASDNGVYFGTSGNPSYSVGITNAGTGHGLRINNSNGGRGLYVVNSGGDYAGYFAGSSASVVIEGNLDVAGSVSKGSGSFKIDHPLDPANKYLYHSFVESPDMMNVYNGNVILNNIGEAMVELPGYFEALNMEFRYQLTCIGGFAPVYISQKIQNNSFEIAGGTSGLEISWQVTGIRNDPYAKKNRIQVEVEKTGEEKGRYLHYKEYNQPVEKSIEALKDSGLSQESDK